MDYPHLTMTPAARARLTGILAVLAAMLLWSTVPVCTKWLAGTRDAAFSVPFISVARLAMAAAIFLALRAVYARRTGAPFLAPPGSVKWLFIAAAALAGNYLLYGAGLRYTTAGATSIISQTHAVAVVLLAAVMLGEPLTRRKGIGMGVAFTGVVVVLLCGSSVRDLLASRFFYGNLLQLAGACIWAFYAIGQTKLLHRAGTRDALTPIFVVAFLLTAPVLPFAGSPVLRAPLLTDWLALLFLGAGGTAAAYWFFAVGLQRIQTSEGAMFNVLAPPLALLLAHWVLGEPFAPHMLAGLALVIAGLVLIVWRRDHAAVTTRTRELLDGSPRADDAAREAA